MRRSWHCKNASRWLAHLKPQRPDCNQCPAQHSATQMSTSFTKEKAAIGKKPKPKLSPSSGADAAPWKAGSPSGATSGRHDRASYCYYCGGQNHPRKDCPASESVCHKCNWCRHYQVVCKSKSVRDISEYLEDEGFLCVVDGGTKQWFTTVKVDGKPIEFRVDTAADVDVMSEQVYQQFLRHKAVQPAHKILKGANKKPLSVIGFVKCVLTKGDMSVQNDLYVIAGASSLFGCASSMILGVVSMVAGIDCHDQYPELCTGLGEMPDDYSISLEETAEPFSSLPMKDPPPLDGQGQGRPRQTRRAQSHPTNHRTDRLVCVCVCESPLCPKRTLRRSESASTLQSWTWG